MKDLSLHLIRAQVSKLLLVFASLFLITACTDGTMPAPKTTGQAILQLQSAYAAALVYEVGYAKLPECNDVVVQACSKTSVVRAVKKASDVANTAIGSAVRIIRTPGYSEDVAVTAMTTALEALNAYIAITNTLGVGVTNGN